MAGGADIVPAPPGLAAAEVLAALHARAYDRPWSARDIETARRAAGGLLLQAGDPARGFVLVRTTVDEAEILALAVDPAARRGGLGRALVEAAAGRAVVAGASALWLEVAEDNRPACALYRATGFCEAGRRRGYYPRQGDAADALVMRRPLNSR